MNACVKSKERGRTAYGYCDSNQRSGPARRAAVRDRSGAWDFWAQDDDFRDGAFATLRREKPISFGRYRSRKATTPERHWALARYDDVHYASRHPQIFSSVPSITIGDNIPELSEFFGSMIVTDDPRHQRLRNIVSRAFTPRSWPGRRSRCGSRKAARRRDDHEPPRRQGRGRRRAGRSAAAAGDLRHDGHSRGRPRHRLPLDQRDPRLRRP